MPDIILDSLPEKASLEFLKGQAKRLLKQFRSGDLEAMALVQKWHPKFRSNPAIGTEVALHDTQFVLARRFGFPSWTALKLYIDEKKNAAQTNEERLIQAVWHGELESVEIEFNSAGTPSAATRHTLAKALEGIADRSVWHRPQYHRIGTLLLSAGIECAIWPAARLGLVGHVRDLIERDPTLLEAPDEKGRTPLQRAALIYGSHSQCEETVRWLIERGARVDIHTAAAFSMPDRVKHEARRDPSVVHQKVQGSTPLNWAVRPRHNPDIELLSTVRILLDAGADIETTDDQENGMHPLHHFGEWRSCDALGELLLARGAELNAKDDIGWTPLDYATTRNRDETIAFLTSRGARRTQVEWPATFGEQILSLIGAAKRGDMPFIVNLLDLNPELVNAREKDGATALHWAAHDGYYELAELLLRRGADHTLQETSYWGGTPLHWAAERQLLLVELLLQYGADINSRNFRTQQTPLHYCARCDDVPEVAEYLLKRGADPSARDVKSKSPLDYALQTGHAGVAAVLQRTNLR